MQTNKCKEGTTTATQKSYLKDCKKVWSKNETLWYFSFSANAKSQGDLTLDICSDHLRHKSP